MQHHKHANTYCNNCNKIGHTFYNCKAPIMSYGIIAFRINPLAFDGKKRVEYLMIRRKDTFGYIHFIRGKYSVHNKSYLLNIFNQMTLEEKNRIRTHTFDQLWRGIWMRDCMDENEYVTDETHEGEERQFNAEEHVSREKFEELRRGIVEYGMKTKYTTESLIEESNATSTQWTEAEWGFPKGRRNVGEKDFVCAQREFAEETGYPSGALEMIENILPFEETTMGSNYKSYRNKYFLAHMDYFESVKPHKEQTCEVSSCEWKSAEEAVACIRDYNVEKRELLKSVDETVRVMVCIK